MLPAALLVCAAAAHVLSATESRAASLCQAGEGIFFSCAVRTKIVSICTKKTADRIEALVYRYGRVGSIEKEFRAAHDNQNRFLGYVSPANPQASIRQVWFAQGPFKYLVTACVGGDCTQSGGIAVLRAQKIQLNVGCAIDPRHDTAWFSPDVVEFGSDLDTTRSKTDLLKLEEADNPIEKIYRSRRVY